MIVITKIKIGDYEVPVPHGLSELLKDAWVLKDETMKNTSADYYTRKIEMRNGRLFTVLTKKGDGRK
jgi:hypothetical protein